MEQYQQALEALYLDRVSGIISPAQFQNLSQRLEAELHTMETQQTAQMALLHPARPSRDTALQALFDAPMPRSLLSQLIECILVEPLDKGAQQQTIHIQWR